MSFDQWMNRPIYRAQVYSCSIGRMLYGDGLSLRFRCKAEYRSLADDAQRIAIATYIRHKRRLGKIRLPHYNAQTGKMEI